MHAMNIIMPTINISVYTYYYKNIKIIVIVINIYTHLHYSPTGQNSQQKQLRNISSLSL